MYATLQPWPYIREAKENSGDASSTPGTAPAVNKKMRLTAMDGNYTIVDVQGVHLNGKLARLTPFGCLRTEETLYEKASAGVSGSRKYLIRCSFMRIG